MSNSEQERLFAKAKEEVVLFLVHNKHLDIIADRLSSDLRKNFQQCNFGAELTAEQTGVINRLMAQVSMCTQAEAEIEIHEAVAEATAIQANYRRREVASVINLSRLGKMDIATAQLYKDLKELTPSEGLAYAEVVAYAKESMHESFTSEFRNRCHKEIINCFTKRHVQLNTAEGLASTYISLFR